MMWQPVSPLTFSPAPGTRIPAGDSSAAWLLAWQRFALDTPFKRKVNVWGTFIRPLLRKVNSRRRVVWQICSDRWGYCRILLTLDRASFGHHGTMVWPANGLSTDVELFSVLSWKVNFMRVLSIAVESSSKIILWCKKRYDYCWSKNENVSPPFLSFFNVENTDQMNCYNNWIYWTFHYHYFDEIIINI